MKTTSQTPVDEAKHEPAKEMRDKILEGPMVDFFMQDLFDAYKEAVQLNSTKSAIDARNRAKRIKLSMEISLGKLARYGIRAEDQWNSLRKVSTGP